MDFKPPVKNNDKDLVGFEMDMAKLLFESALPALGTAGTANVGLSLVGQLKDLMTPPPPEQQSQAQPSQDQSQAPQGQTAQSWQPSSVTFQGPNGPTQTPPMPNTPPPPQIADIVQQVQSGQRQLDPMTVNEMLSKLNGGGQNLAPGA